MRENTTEDQHRQRSQHLIREVLGDNYVCLNQENIIVSEDGSVTAIASELIVNTEKEMISRRKISGIGSGLIDALFNALLYEYSDECVSLTSLKIEEFYIFVDQADLRRRRLVGNSGTDALVGTCLTVDNGNDRIIPFRSTNRSVIFAMSEVVLSAIEFFINSERAMLHLRTCVRDAEGRKRPDLVELYTLKMAELVKNTSYVESLRGMDE
jgi:hypothetical protein